MVKKSNENKQVKNYKKTGIIAAVVIAVAALGVWAVSALNGGNTSSVEEAMEVVSGDAQSAANLRIAVVRMDEIQTTAVALKDYYYANPVEMNVYENQIAKAKEYGFTSVFHATRLITKYGLGPTKQMELNIFSIGNSVAFYTAPAELWDSFSEETEALSPFPITFCIGYCNGGVAYIPYKLDYYVSYEYFYCLFKQDDVINQMQDYYLENLNRQFNVP